MNCQRQTIARISPFMIIIFILAIPIFGGYNKCSSSSYQGSNINTVFPFNQASPAEMKASGKKVFAHYFPSFPISRDNKPAPIDFYSMQYIKETGEKNKHISYGGLIRERPLPREPIANPNWKQIDMENEIRSAAKIGLDGFTLCIISVKNRELIDNYKALVNAADAINEEASNNIDFKIALMPDMTSISIEEIDDIINLFKNNKCILKDSQNRIVLMPFKAEQYDPDKWEAVIKQAENRLKGVEGVSGIVFFPNFLDMNPYAEAFKEISMGYCSWGTRYSNGLERYSSAPARAHQYVSLWMQPITPQDVRNYSQRTFEYNNSAGYRESWKAIIENDVDWVQIITWNDYHEGTEIAPSTGIQNTFYDLSAYYITWFKTGHQPAITKDALYYFHRIQHTYDYVDPSVQTAGKFKFDGVYQPSDLVEVVVFLTQPGKVIIKQSGNITAVEAEAGVTSITAPLMHGIPEFFVERNGLAIIHGKSQFEVKENLKYQDFLYRGGKLLPYFTVNGDDDFDNP